MSIIQSHGYTLYGCTDKYDIILRPLSDEHLPYLYKWNADPEVLYWTEGGKDIVRSYDHKTVHQIYGGVSENAYCFLIEAGEDYRHMKPIGECWLQKMNLPDIIAMYNGEDVRRIDMAIGEKEYRNKGIGTAFIKMLIEFAFCVERATILHCFSEDYNIRSQKMWLKNGFKLVREDDLPQPQKGKKQYHFALTRQEYIQKRRRIIPPEKVFQLPILSLQPSQLVISEGKLNLVKEWFDGNDQSKMDALPVKSRNERYLLTDGHTRAVFAYLSGWQIIPVYLDEDELNMEAYTTDVRWCDEEGIKNIADLSKRIVSAKDYEILWRKRCMEM